MRAGVSTDFEPDEGELGSLVVDSSQDDEFYDAEEHLPSTPRTPSGSRRSPRVSGAGGEPWTPRGGGPRGSGAGAFGNAGGSFSSGGAGDNELVRLRFAKWVAGAMARCGAAGPRALVALCMWLARDCSVAMPQPSGGRAHMTAAHALLRVNHRPSCSLSRQLYPASFPSPANYPTQVQCHLQQIHRPGH